MHKAVTLIEILIAVTIMATLLYFASPLVFAMQDRTALNGEIANLQSFIYQIQTEARYRKRNYTLTLSQQNRRWCAIAVKKPKESSKQIVCDCLHPQWCNLSEQYHLYTPTSQDTLLKSKSLYPKAFINIDGVSGQSEAKCLHISLNQESEILQFEQLGRVYVAPKDKRSTCKD